VYSDPETIFTCRGHRLRGQLGDARFHPVGRLNAHFTKGEYSPLFPVQGYRTDCVEGCQ